ncbi:MAG: hypothetical protein GXY83_24125 [Rhodopirellula sp.]|nr:hypothetical protein [Rhodopirellula sp.]
MTIPKTVFGLSAGVVLLALTGCGSKPDVWCTVTDDLRAIAEARERADRVQDREIATLLAHLADPLLDTDAFAVLRGKQGPSVDQLRAIASGDPITDKTVGAAVVLCTLDDGAGLDTVRRILADGPQKQRQKLLEAMNFSAQAMATVSANERLRAMLLAQLDDPDPGVVQAAVQVCGRYDVPGASAKLSTMLPNPAGLARERICYWLSRFDPQPAHVESIVKLMPVGDQGDGKPWWVQSLLHFAECDDPAASRRAADVLRDQRNVAAWNHVDQYLRQDVTEALIERSTAPDIPWLNSLLAGDVSDYTKCRVMLALDRVDGGQGGRLLAALDDPKLRSYAASALGEMAKDTQDGTVVQRLKDATADEDRPAVLAAVAGALLDVGGDKARMAAMGFTERLEPGARMSIMWRANGWNAVSAMDQVVGAGLLDESAYRKALKDLEVEAKDDRNGDASLLGVLWEADVFLAFDAENGMLPCRHDQLLRDFANSSRGVFTPEAVCQQWHQRGPEDFEADYTLQFIYHGRLYRVQLRNQGDWYDVERLVMAVNRALQDAGHSERFHALAGGGQVAEFVFATPKAVQKLASELYLPVDEDLNRAMREGKEFEQKVLESM